MEHEEKKYGNWPPFREQLSILSVVREKDSTKRLVKISHNGYRFKDISGDQTINGFSNSFDLSKEKTDEENGFGNPGFVKDEV